MWHPGHHPPTSFLSASPAPTPWIWFCYFSSTKYNLYGFKMLGKGSQKDGHAVSSKVWRWAKYKRVECSLVGAEGRRASCECFGGEGGRFSLPTRIMVWMLEQWFGVKGMFWNSAPSTTFPSNCRCLGSSGWTCRGPGASAAPFQVWSASGFHDFSVLFLKNS